MTSRDLDRRRIDRASFCKQRQLKLKAGRLDHLHPGRAGRQKRRLAVGREALTWAEVGGEAGDVRALLESTELILRGDIRREFPRDRLARVRIDGDFLRFDCDGETVALQLGATVADRWAKAIDTPPPGLRAKLGLAEGAHALRVGLVDDTALEMALAGVLVDAVENADMIVACISGPADLEAALAVHAASPALPLWVVYPKGKGVAFGDGEIRSILRAHGFRDTKSCAVSDQLTASRYSPQRPQP